MKAEGDGADRDLRNARGGMRLGFVILSFALIIFAAMVIARHYSRQWRVYQREYYDLLAAKIDNGRGARNGHSGRNHASTISSPM